MCHKYQYLLINQRIDPTRTSFIKWLMKIMNWNLNNIFHNTQAAWVHAQIHSEWNRARMQIDRGQREFKTKRFCDL